MAMIHAALNGVAARLAAESATDAELAEISRIHRESRDRDQSEEVESSHRAADLRHDLHGLVVEASHSPSLVDMIATAEAFGRPLRLRAQREPGADKDIRQAVDEHKEIVDALLDRDGELAETLMRQHTMWVSERYLGFAESLGIT